MKRDAAPWNIAALGYKAVEAAYTGVLRCKDPRLSMEERRAEPYGFWRSRPVPGLPLSLSGARPNAGDVAP